MQGNPDFLILPSNSHAQKGRGQKTVFPNENICQLFFGSPIPYMKSFGEGIGLFHVMSTFSKKMTLFYLPRTVWIVERQFQLRFFRIDWNSLKCIYIFFASWSENALIFSETRET